LALFLVAHENTYKWYVSNYVIPKGHQTVAELLLAGKAEVNAKDKYGQTPLHLAAGMGHKATAELLLTNRAEVNAKNDAGRTPLHEAAVFDQKDVVKMLRQQRGRE
jgi:ankyrin repeat protein